MAPEVLADLPREHLAAVTEAVFAVFENLSFVTVLGLVWQAKDDVFRFDIDCEFHGIPTKRFILSKIYKIFDPMGRIALVIISAKVFIQSLWLLKSDWDDPLPTEYA